jgi:hypothetical protein
MAHVFEVTLTTAFGFGTGETHRLGGVTVQVV